MEYLREIRERNNLMKWLAIICLLATIIILSSYLGITHYRPFHIAVESFSSFIAFSILIMAINTHEISRNVPFLFLGVAYGLAGGFNIIHILASNGMGFFQGDSTNLSMIFSIISRYITAISILIYFRMLHKSFKMITSFIIIFGFAIFSAAILISIFCFNKFPVCYVPGLGSTYFKIITEYSISVIELTNIVVLFRAKRHIEPDVFLLLQLSLYTAILGNILLTFYTSQQGLSNLLAHIVKAISFYFIYRAIVKVGLKTPYKLLFNEINQKNNLLELKDSQLNRTFNQLQEENGLRKNIEEILIKNESCYELLIENSRDAIIIYNYEKIVFANEGAACIFGIDRTEKLLGKKVTEFFSSSTQLTLLETIKNRCVKEGIIPTYETQISSTDSNVIYVEVTSAYVIYQNESAILSLVRDISSRKQIEKMKKKVEEDKRLISETLESNQLITEFFSNVSHELRTPLNVILSALQVLTLEKQKGTLEEVVEKRDRYIRVIKQNCYRLLRLINNLIDISKIDSGYTTLHMQNYNIVSLVEDITLSVAEYIEDKGIKFIFDTNVEEKIIACDQDKIERIMLNLLSNAVKFTNRGDEISVRVMDEGDNIKISVKDTGIGISEDKLQVIFERFIQAHHSISNAQEGSGIGLSLVKALVEMHGGSIDVKSSIGEGSEFTIKLPVKTNDDTKVVANNLFDQSNTEKVCIEFSDIIS
jgi:PAS domain S-box-containing protein